MSLNGAGTFVINTAGQPVVSGTTISSSVFNALMTDIAGGISTAIMKDGQTTVTANIPMSAFKFTGLGIGTANTDSATVQNANVLNMCEFRLSGTTAVAVTTADVTAIETLYWTPYKGNRVALYNGTNWVMRSSTELTLDVPDATNCYDVFVYDNAGTVAIESLAWTNITTRATALALLNGVLTKSGDSTRRYVGTFYCTTAGNGQTEDSIANRYVWNYYNRVRRPMRVLETTNTWSYATATIRQANASTANQLNFVLGVAEDVISAKVVASVQGSVVAQGAAVGIGLDDTTAFTAGNLFPVVQIPAANALVALFAEFATYASVGKHFLSWNEIGNANGTNTWQGDNAAQMQSGIYGEIFG